MEKSDMILRTWDQKRNSADTKIFDAIQVIGEPLTNNENQNYVETMIISPMKEPKYIMPLPDSNGNLIYYNSFGEVEQKKVHSYFESTIYPDYVGRMERHDHGFQQLTILEDLRAMDIVHTLILDPIKESEKKSTIGPFLYPTDVGRLDRRFADQLENQMLHEHEKATKIYSKLYKTNHVED
jgi:hypothetical protein